MVTQDSTYGIVAAICGLFILMLCINSIRTLNYNCAYNHQKVKTELLGDGNLWHKGKTLDSGRAIGKNVVIWRQ